MSAPDLQTAPVRHASDLQLDREARATYAYDPRPWGRRPVLLPLVTLAGLVVLGKLIGHVVHPSGFAAQLTVSFVLDIALYLVLALAVRSAGGPIARRYGGWGNTFGLRRPRWIDLAWIAAGLGMVFAGRIAVAVLAVAVTNGDALRQAQNLHVDSTSPAVYAVLALVVVGAAPVIEETVFRGLLLRTFMRRMRFWPAALLSSALFAGFHLYEVSTLAGAVTLFAVTGVLGVVNCLLVRFSGRLVAGMVVHAIFNAAALAALYYQATH